ncbi:MAG: S1 RNA-binding domain-containing protein [Cyclobacteriaceae bacterium]
MIFESIINGIKERLGLSDKDDWITERLNEIENHRDNFDTLPFKIVELKDFGFLTKVKGLYSYISFYHMPWKYYDKDSWIAIAPSLIDKKFYCKIHKIDKDPTVIILNGEIPQFKKAELIIGEEYKGLIIKITDYGLFIDIGFHYNWKCGSITGLLHKSQLTDNEKISDYELGQEIKTVYQELNKSGQPVFSNDREKIDWQIGKPQKLVGQTIWAKVIRQPESKAVYLLIKGKYKSVLTINKQAYAPKYRKIIKKAKNDLKHGEIVNCEVTGFNEKNRILKVKWLIEIDTEIIVDNSISNNLDNDTLKKLITLKNKI